MAEVTLNDCVSKIGKKTQKSSGKVVSLNASIRVPVNCKNKHGYITMTNQVMVNNLKIESGDSGSIITKKNDAVGVLFAGDNQNNKAFFTPIHKIFNTKNGNNIGEKPPYHFKNFLKTNPK